MKKPVLQDLWSRNLIPGAEAKIIFFNTYCGRFGGCKDEDKPPLDHISYDTTVIVQL